MLERCVDGTIDYHFTDDTLTAQSYRENIKDRLIHSPWFNFGIHICLGEPTDRNMIDSLRPKNWCPNINRVQEKAVVLLTKEENQ